MLTQHKSDLNTMQHAKSHLSEGSCFLFSRLLHRFLLTELYTTHNERGTCIATLDL